MEVGFTLPLSLIESTGHKAEGRLRKPWGGIISYKNDRKQFNVNGRGPAHSLVIRHDTGKTMR